MKFEIEGALGFYAKILVLRHDWISLNTLSHRIFKIFNPLFSGLFGFENYTRAVALSIFWEFLGELYNFFYIMK